jgi:hypothetical protein
LKGAVWRVEISRVLLTYYKRSGDRGAVPLPLAEIPKSGFKAVCMKKTDKKISQTDGETQFLCTVVSMTEGNVSLGTHHAEISHCKIFNGASRCHPNAKVNSKVLFEIFP